MDIHKPKHWHGLREFLKEYATIVIGVLTALAAEQVVEQLREHRLSGEARAAVREELDSNLASISRRAEVQPCIDRRIADIGRLLNQAERGERFEPATLIGIPQGFAVTTQRWQAATAGGGTRLLSSAEQGRFARVYTQFEVFLRRENAEDATWGRLLELEGRSTLSPQMIAYARTALGEARMENYGIKRNVSNARATAAEIGITGAARNFSGPPSNGYLICLPLTTPRAEAQKRLGDPIGLP